jgi:DNA-binding GntR family transcriptional regulator
MTNKRLPNERLVETDLSQRFATNRNVVRSVLLRLEADGLIIREPNRGARVRVITIEEAREIVDIRAAIEVIVARRAAERAAAPDVLELRAILADMHEALDGRDYLRYTQLNATLHAVILKVSAHTLGAKMLVSLHSQSVRSQYRAVFVPGRAETSLAEHEEIAEAIAAGNPERAATAMERHMSHVLRTINELARFGLHD